MSEARYFHFMMDFAGRGDVAMEDLEALKEHCTLFAMDLHPKRNFEVTESTPSSHESTFSSPKSAPLWSSTSYEVKYITYMTKGDYTSLPLG
jgi:hypothetical protein